MNGVNRLDLSKFFVKAPLIPVVCQDERSGEVLMLGYANEQALQLTMDTGTAWFFSRSRQKLWNKGETSGNFIFVSRILSDCDDDTLIYVGTPKGPVCHTGHRTCFFTTLWEKQEGSYTCYLFEKGIDKILKKVGEECAETIIAAKNGDKAELVGEINDVFYHMMVMMNECGVTMEDVCKEMDIRAQKIGNLKKFHVSDHNT